MTNKNRILPVMAAFVLLLCAPTVHADPQFSISSPLNSATLGLFASDADHFMSVRDYADLDFSKWLGIASYKRQRTTGNIAVDQKLYESGNLAQLGFAARFGDLYVGASYIGNAWQDIGKLANDGNLNLNTYTMFIK